MKKNLLTLAACAAIAMSANAVEAGDANIYASGLKVTQDGVQFVLNATPKEVLVKFYNGETLVKTITVDNAVKGLNTVYLEGAFEGIAANTSLTWEVVATAEANINVVSFHDENNADQQFKAAAGLAIETDQTKSNFGKIYIANSIPGETIGRTVADGIYMLNSDLSAINTEPYTGGVSWKNNNEMSSIASPKNIALDKDGNLFISDWSDSEVSGVWIMDTNHPEADFNSVFDVNLTNTSGTVKNNKGNVVHGSVAALLVKGEGENRVLYTLDEDIQNATRTQKGSVSDYDATPIAKYNIGTLMNPWSSKFEAFYVNVGKEKGENIDARCSGCFAESEYGIWFAQAEAIEPNWPSLVHFTENGEVNYNFYTNFGVNYADVYSVAVNKENTKLAIGQGANIRIFDLTYSNDGVPSLTNELVIKTGKGLRPYGLAFDVVDNIYSTNTASSSFVAYALPKANNSYTTVANAPVLVNETMTGIADVAVDANAPVEYYNLQGVKVANPENGIFIKKQGAKATKVVL